MQVRVIEYSCQSWSYGVYALYVWVYLSLSCEFLMRLLCLIHRHAFILLCMLAHHMSVANIARLLVVIYISHRELQLDLISHWDYELIYLHIICVLSITALPSQCHETYFPCVINASHRLFFFIVLYSLQPLVCLYSQRCIGRDRLVVAARQRIPQVCLPCVCHTSCYLLVVATLIKWCIYAFSTYCL